MHYVQIELKLITMKTKSTLITLIGLLAVTALVFQSCKKEDENINKPTCTITSPTNGQELTKGEIITISANATDGDGGIFKVEFFVDNKSKGSVTNPPFEYKWNTSGESIGNHTIKATSTDNSGGSASDEISVELINSAGSTFTDNRDGQTYKIISFGNKSSLDNQTWFAENLNFDTAGSWWYNSSSANGDVYGRLYTWKVASVVCPKGWHLPSDEEWKTLEMALGMSQEEADKVNARGTDEGKKLKSKTNWIEDGNGTDEIGFDAQPGGFRHPGGSGIYGQMGIQGLWWSSTEYDNIWAYNRALHYDKDESHREYGGNKDNAFSVRCLRDY